MNRVLSWFAFLLLIVFGALVYLAWRPASAPESLRPIAQQLRSWLDAAPALAGSSTRPIRPEEAAEPSLAMAAPASPQVPAATSSNVATGAPVFDADRGRVVQVDIDESGQASTPGAAVPSGPDRLPEDPAAAGVLDPAATVSEPSGGSREQLQEALNSDRIAALPVAPGDSSVSRNPGEAVEQELAREAGAAPVNGGATDDDSAEAEVSVALTQADTDDPADSVAKSPVASADNATESSSSAAIGAAARANARSPVEAAAEIAERAIDTLQQAAASAVAAAQSALGAGEAESTAPLAQGAEPATQDLNDIEAPTQAASIISPASDPTDSATPQGSLATNKNQPAPPTPQPQVPELASAAPRSDPIAATDVGRDEPAPGGTSALMDEPLAVASARTPPSALSPETVVQPRSGPVPAPDHIASAPIGEPPSSDGDAQAPDGARESGPREVANVASAAATAASPRDDMATLGRSTPPPSAGDDERRRAARSETDRLIAAVTATPESVSVDPPERSSPETRVLGQIEESASEVAVKPDAPSDSDGATEAMKARSPRVIASGKPSQSPVQSPAGATPREVARAAPESPIELPKIALNSQISPANRARLSEVLPPDAPLPKPAESPEGKAQEDQIKNFLAGKVIEFQIGRDKLTPKGKRALNALATLIQEHRQTKIVVQGHTDNVGDKVSNLELSGARALVARDYLIARGVSPKRLSVQAMGESRPVASNRTDDGRRRNRRIDFAITE